MIYCPRNVRIAVRWNSVKSDAWDKADIRMKSLWDWRAGDPKMLLREQLHSRAEAIVGTKEFGIGTLDVLGHGYTSGRGMLLDTQPDFIQGNRQWSLSTGNTSQYVCGIADFMTDLDRNMLTDARIFLSACYTAKHGTDPQKNLAKSAIDAVMKAVWVSGFAGFCSTLDFRLHPNDRAYDMRHRWKPEGGTKWWCYQRAEYGGGVTRVERANRLNP